MLCNFSLANDSNMPTGILIGQHEWNMHYNSDFAGFEYDVYRRTVVMHWNVSGFDFTDIPSYLANKIDMVLDEVYYLEVVARDSEMPDNEDRTLTSISYCNNNEDPIQKWDGGIPAGCLLHPGNNCHIVFNFLGGQIIRIGAHSCNVILCE